MVVLDSSVILRYLLADDETMYKKAKEIVENESCLLLPEVLAEVVQILTRLYKVPREDLAAVLMEFLNFDNVLIGEEYIRALFLYGHGDMEFLEAVLCVYGEERRVATFDPKLKKCLKKEV